MSNDIVELLDISIVFYSVNILYIKIKLGNFMSKYYLLKTYGVLDILLILLALGHALAPTSKLNEIIFPYDKKKEFVTYE